MSRFDCFEGPLNGLKIIHRKALEDERGFLSRIFCAETFSQYGFVKVVNQINQSLTRQKGSVRGLHYQLTPYSFRPKVALKISSKNHHDLGQGILDCVYDEYQKLKNKGELKSLNIKNE